MANTFLNANNLGLITKEAVYELNTISSWTSVANRDYEGFWDDQKMYNPGETIQLRQPNNFIPQEGDSVTAQEIKEISTSLTLGEIISVPIAYSVRDITISAGGTEAQRMKSFNERLVFPAVKAILGRLYTKISTAAEESIYSYVGDETANITAFANVDNAGVKLLQKGCSRMTPLYSALSLKQSALLRQSSTIQNSFVNPINKEVTLNSSLGRLAGFGMFEDVTLRHHLTYTDDARTGVTVKTTVADGASTIVLTGLTASKTGIVKKGDVFSFTGIYSVHPVTLESTGEYMQVVATADADSDVSGDATVSVSPVLIYLTTNPNRNLSSQIIATTPVVFVGSHTVNVAWQRDGLHVVCPRLAPFDSAFSKVHRDPKTGISMRLSKTDEILEGKNIMRLDLLPGIKWLPERATRILSL